jgi:dCMP deaminase
MDIAKRVALMSHAERKKVGAILEKDGNIISMGWNGTPSGFDNVCEDGDNKTKPEVLHAELNLISKLAKSTNSSVDSNLYVTLSPCQECAKLIIQSGISKVFYSEEYRDLAGVELLKKAGLVVCRLNFGDLE